MGSKQVRIISITNSTNVVVVAAAAKNANTDISYLLKYSSKFSINNAYEFNFVLLAAGFMQSLNTNQLKYEHKRLRASAMLQHTEHFSCQVQPN